MTINSRGDDLDPKIEIVGVYELEVTPEIFAEQLPMYGNEIQCSDHFSSVVLIEAIIHNAGNRFNVDDFRQPKVWRPDPAIHPGGIQEEGTFQAAWDEGLLSADGNRVLARRIGCANGAGNRRLAFYLHYWDDQFPLEWSYGTVNCPAPRPMPDRLKQLMPNRSCD